ncbi:MAG: excinuclease ABC subunit UvrC [Candidatus Saccharimonadales bacterium]
MQSRLKSKLAKLPASPGVYFYKDKTGEIIYIGKAANLKNRVKQYFQKNHTGDPKTKVLISEIADLDFTPVETEADALFLEAELVRRYLPRFNILLRDDKSQLYIRIDINSDYPTVKLVRRPLDDGAKYFGPYESSFAIKRALRYLRRAFPYAENRPVAQKRVSLHYHLGLDPGLEEGKTSLEAYRTNLRKLMQYLSGRRKGLVREIEREMKKAAKAQDFEKAAIARNQLAALQQLSRQILFSDREIAAASYDKALVEIMNLLDLPKPPRRIEGFDISHMQGTDTAASMVVFINGLPDKTAYRKFKMRYKANDDFAHMKETISRRLREINRQKWGLPDLVLIDGGKGQLAAALAARDECGLDFPMIGLAKREEEIILAKSEVAGQTNSRFMALGAHAFETKDFIRVILPASSHLIKLLQRIRDESHRFALSYHSTLKRRRQTTSLLDEVLGVGPLTKKKLLRYFGSTRRIFAADPTDLVAILGPKKGADLSKHLSSVKSQK